MAVKKSEMTLWFLSQWTTPITNQNIKRLICLLLSEMRMRKKIGCYSVRTMYMKIRKQDNLHAQRVKQSL